MRVLADEQRVSELIDSLADRLGRRLADDAGTPWALVGIRSRGDVLARRLAERLGTERLEQRVGALDITLYRDDLGQAGAQPVVRPTEIPFDVAGLNVVLVDDVIMSGRTVRAALGSLMDLGRPRRVWLAVLVDRGGRELPIVPDEVALNLAAAPASPCGPHERVAVHLRPADDRDAIVVAERRGDHAGGGHGEGSEA